MFDTTRAVANLVVSGTLERYPAVRLLVAHAGGKIPYLHDRILDRGPILQRVARTPAPTPEELVELMEAGLRKARGLLATLFYDTALSANETVLAALGALVPASRVLFGTDFPFAQDLGAKLTLDGLGRHRGFTTGERRAIEGDTRALFPRLDHTPTPAQSTKERVA